MSAYNKNGDVIATLGNSVDISNIKDNHPTYTDDQILEAAISEAKRIGESAVIVWDGEDIHFSGQITHECKGFGGINFNGSTIYMPNYEGEAIISVVPDTTEDITAQSADLKSLYTTNASLKGKIFRLNQTLNGNADMCLGYRYGESTDAVIYSAPTVKTSLDGYYETGELFLPPQSGTVECYNVHEYPAVTFEICNATIVTHNSTNATILIDCTRSNCHIHNFVLQGQSTRSEFYWGLFVFTSCSDIEVDHISGISPIKRTLTSGYFMALRSVSYAYIHNIYVGDTSCWGAIGCRYLTNCTFERCYMNRWDCHFAQFGFNVIRECVIQFFTYGVGNGATLIENCTFMCNDTSANAISLIVRRPDCPGVYDGEITVRNCKFLVATQPTNLVIIWSDANTYAKPSNSKLSGAPKRSRIIENCQFPDGCYSIIKTGTETVADMPMFENLAYKIKDCDISCTNAVVYALASGLEVKEVEIDHCTVDSGYMLKAISCDLEVSGSDIVNISADTTLPNLIATGNTFSGSQSVSGFTNYALSGNIASDMASVNKHSN